MITMTISKAIASVSDGANPARVHQISFIPTLELSDTGGGNGTISIDPHTAEPYVLHSTLADCEGLFEALLQWSRDAQTGATDGEFEWPAP